MKKIILFVIIASFTAWAETLFQVKDSQERVVLDVSTDGLRIMNQGDTLMVISSEAVKVNLSNSKDKVLSRTFSVTTATSKKGFANVLEVGTQSTTMREGLLGERYTDFGPKNIFLGLNAGNSIDGGKYNVFIGNFSGNTTTGPEVPDMSEFGYYNTFIGYESGKAATNSYYNTYIGANSGSVNTDGSDNTFVGTNTGKRNTGHSNTFTGTFSAGYGLGNGSGNSFFGKLSGAKNTSGANNVFLGFGAGESNETGSDNVYAGRYAGGSNISGQGNVFIGRSAGSQETGSNKLYIANSSTATPLIKGTFPNTDLTFKATTITADGNLTVTGNSSITGTTTSTGLLSTGNHLRITNDPGTGTTPTYYAYQGSAGSTSKQYAFAIRDALWVTSNSFFDGSVNIGTGTAGSNKLRVESANTGINGSTGYFYNTGTGGIALSALANTTDVVLYVNQSNTTSATANIVKFASDYGGWSEKVYIQNSGKLFAPYLGSGTGTYLQVTTGGEIVKISSSRKYKKEIENLSVDPSKFMQLQPVSFKWNEKSSTENKEDYGLIAEDVEKIDPLLAVYDSDGMIEGVDYQKINIMLLKVVQEQQKAIEDMRKEIDLLKETAK